MNKELIELLKQGTHCIEMPSNQKEGDYYQLSKAANEVLNISSIITKGYSYYKYNSGHLLGMDITDLITIPLSSFIDTPKMISVEAVKEKLNEMIRDYQDEGNSDNSNINNRVIGAIRACNKLLTFLNTHTNVKENHKPA